MDLFCLPLFHGEVSWGMKKISAMVLMFILSCAPVMAASEYLWELQRNQEGIKVFTRPVDGSPIHEFKAETIVNAPLEKVAAFYERVDRTREWFHRSKEVRLLTRTSETESLVYFAADLPWPLSDRDGIYRRRKTEDKSAGAVIYKLSSAGDIYPRQKGRVRVLYLNAEWRFQHLPDNRTAVYYRMHTTAGGFIPPALINTFTVPLPFKTLRNFRALVNEASQRESRLTPHGRGEIIPAQKERVHAV